MALTSLLLSLALGQPATPELTPTQKLEACERKATKLREAGVRWRGHAKIERARTTTTAAALATAQARLLESEAEKELLEARPVITPAERTWTAVGAAMIGAGAAGAVVGAPLADDARVREGLGLGGAALAAAGALIVLLAGL